MARKTIDSSTVRKIAAEVDCDSATVRRVFRRGGEGGYAVSRRVRKALEREGFLDPKGEGER